MNHPQSNQAPNSASLVVLQLSFKRTNYALGGLGRFALLGVFAVLVTPREEEPQINVTMANV